MTLCEHEERDAAIVKYMVAEYTPEALAEMLLERLTDNDRRGMVENMIEGETK